MLLGFVAGALAIVALGYAGITFLTPPPVATPIDAALAPLAELDNTWGTYLSEREWGTPREDVAGNPWGMTWTGAITTDYRDGDDGIAGWTDSKGEFRLGWAFWDGTQDHVTERFDGLSGPAGPAGEGISDDRQFLENSAAHAYSRLTYLYPKSTRWFSISLEAARYNSSSMALEATVTNTTSDARTLNVVFKSWMGQNNELEPLSDGVLMHGTDSYVAVIGQPPSEWQISADKGALDANLRGTGLDGNQDGNIAALAYKLEIPAGAKSVIRIGAAQVKVTAATPDAAARSQAWQDAAARQAQSDSIIAARAAENDGTFDSQVTQHTALYSQALSSLLWNETYYAWNGDSAVNPGFGGKVDAHDVLLLPDKWEYPWPRSWETAFESVTASLIDPALAQDQLRFMLSDRWQQADGHVPCSEWQMATECPPIFAWAAWRVYEQGHDLEFLQDVYPGLQRLYDYWWSHETVGGALFGGGALGMDNLPRAGTGAAQADGTAWMAFFARDMARIASELRDTSGSERYWVDRGTIQDALNTHLWDNQTGFYYDLNTDGTLFKQKSYSGLIPLIAGAVPPERLLAILSALRDTGAFLSPGGIRSLSAQSNLYEPGPAGTGINTNWRGPVWVPINYLLIGVLQDVDPSLAEDVRDRVVGNVEADWQSSGRLHEFFDGDSGVGLGADEDAGWTALVANLVHENWPAPATQ